MDRSPNAAAATPAPTLFADALEPRRLLASISGTVIEDLNNDGNRDNRERGIPGVVVYLDQNRNSRLDAGEARTTTDASGFYEFNNLPPDRYTVRHNLVRGHNLVYPSKRGAGNFGRSFDIDLEFLDNKLPSFARSLFESAAARWEKVLVGDLPDVFDEEFGNIDDILITVRAAQVDGEGGVLASAGPDLVRDSTSEKPNLPYRGSMRFDLADLKLDLYETILHEMGHALGFTLSTWFSFEDRELVGGTPSAPYFLGENAVREYRSMFPKARDIGVPLENFQAGQGSSFSHFSEFIFKNELMTPTSEGDTDGEPLSRLTVALMQDIGYDVDYRYADPYVPNGGPIPPTSPLIAGGGPDAYGFTLDITDDSQALQGQDFMSRANRAPTVDRLAADQPLYQTGAIIKLRAVGPGDVDAGDRISAVNFYIESNGLPGLQSGPGGDDLLGTDTNPAGGYRFNVNTEALGLSPGQPTFYVRAYDQLDVAGPAQVVTVNLFAPDSAPRKPTGIVAAAIDRNSVRVQWNDRSANEFGFLLERATNRDFSQNVERFVLDAETQSFTNVRLQPSTTYYYRVRSFNVGGSSGWNGPVIATTPALGEELVDNDDTTQFALRRGAAQQAAGGALFGTTAVASGANARVAVSPLVEFKGDYFVYARWADLGVSVARAVFNVVDANGRTQRPISIDQNDRGGAGSYVLLGRFFFDTLGTATITLRAADGGQTVNLDALRVVPAFTPAAKRR